MKRLFENIFPVFQIRLKSIFEMNISSLRNIISEQNLKKQIVLVLNAICLLFLFYNAIDMTFDYLRFEFSYKLIVDNKEGFDLPEISVCTENNVLFAKNKVIQYFGIENEWRKKRIQMKNLNEQSENDKVNCIEEWRKEHHQEIGRESIEWRINFCSNKVFIQYKKFIFDEMSFYEMNSITFNANELFDCSAIIHIKHTFIDPNVTYIDYCFHRFPVLESIYFNEDFGICYKFFSSNHQIFLKDKDHINITIKFRTQKDFMIVDRSVHIEFVHVNSLRYFVWYVMVSDRHSSNRETAIELNKVGFDARISFDMTSIQLLSTPYMTFCLNNGKYFNHFILDRHLL